MMRDQRGIALVLTLWVLALMGVLAMEFARFIRDEAKIVRNFKDESEAYYLALVAYDEARNYILSDPDPDVDWVDQDGLYRTDEKREPFLGVFNSGGISVKASVLDEESRVNINTAPPEVLKQLLSGAGIPDNEVDSVMDAIADWTDPDDLQRLMGAEDEHYEPLGYLPRNAQFMVPEELMYVKGITRDSFYGLKSGAGLHDKLTTWGDGININTVDLSLLKLYGLSPVQIDYIAANRKAKNSLRALPPELAGFGRLGSRHYRVIVRLSTAEGQPEYMITAVLKKVTTQSGADMKVLYWKEGYADRGV